MPGLATGQYLSGLASSEGKPTEVREQGPQPQIGTISREHGAGCALGRTANASRFRLFTNKDGGWEYPAFWIVGLLVLAALGDGALALGPALGLS